MMYLNFKCNSCKHEFTTIDEYKVLCPECHKSDVQVIWDKSNERKKLITKLTNKDADRNDEALHKLND